MNSQDFLKKKLPDSCGVYFFLGAPERRVGGLGRNKKILYIGKATSLRTRVRSYFAGDIAEKRSPLIARMVAEARTIDWRVTDSVLEALILEADLIKKFQPPYNTDEKDDKSFNCVVITREDFPRVLVVRKHDFNVKIHDSGFMIQEWYGPFPNGGQLQIALKIIRRIFPYRDSKCTLWNTDARGFRKTQIHADKKATSSVLISDDIRFSQRRGCFNRQIGLCPGVCTGEISKAEYAKTVRNIKLFFSGKKGQILKNLKWDMRAAAKAQDFERAGEIKKTIFALEHIQDVALLKTDNQLRAADNCRIEAYDVAHLSGTDVVGVMVVVEDGMTKKSDYRKFKIRGGFGNNDVANLNEVIERRLNHPEWPLPALFVADGGGAQKQVIEDALKVRGLSVPVVAVTKNERHRPERIVGDASIARVHERAILLGNVEAHRFALSFHLKLRRMKFK